MLPYRDVPIPSPNPNYIDPVDQLRLPGHSSLNFHFSFVSFFMYEKSGKNGISALVKSWFENIVMYKHRSINTVFKTIY